MVQYCFSLTPRTVTHFAERLKAPLISLDADRTPCGQRCRFWVIRVVL